MNHVFARFLAKETVQRVVFQDTDKLKVQIFRYFFVGGTAAIVDLSIFWLLVSAAGVHYLLAAAISFTLATIVNYVLCIKWVFRQGRRKRVFEFSLVIFVSLIGILFNQVGLLILVEFIALHYMLAKIIATGLVFFWNFFARRKYVFL